jgi:hypothetical protein
MCSEARSGSLLDRSFQALWKLHWAYLKHGRPNGCVKSAITTSQYENLQKEHKQDVHSAECQM